MKTNNLLLVIIHLFSFCTLYAQWTPLNAGTVLDLTIINQNSSGSILIGASGENFSPGPGGIFKSDDGGINWDNVANNTKGFSDIVFLPSGIGLSIPKSRDSIFKSLDGGNTWTKQYSQNCYGPSRGFPNVVFTDAMTGYAPGYKTIDGGDSWFSQFPMVQTFPYIPTQMTFLNDSTGIIVGFEYWGAIAKTTDRGLNWTWVSVPGGTWEIYSVHFPTPTTGYATSYKYTQGEEAEILKTTDAGDNWTSVFNDSLSTLFHSISCTDANTCYAVGNHGKILKTTDGGISWNNQYSGTDKALRKVFFTDLNTGYIVGDSGTVLKTINGGGTTNINALHSTINKVSIYPNPSKNIFTVEMEDNPATFYQFTLYSILGEKLIDIPLSTQKCTFNISAHPNNIYFYTVTSDNGFIQTGKLIKVE